MRNWNLFQHLAASPWQIIKINKVFTPSHTIHNAIRINDYFVLFFLHWNHECYCCCCVVGGKIFSINGGIIDGNFHTFHLFQCSISIWYWVFFHIDFLCLATYSRKRHQFSIFKLSLDHQRKRRKSHFDTSTPNKYIKECKRDYRLKIPYWNEAIKTRTHTYKIT